ncbi:MAG: NADH-quinone oxidoreductase subunit L [Planctomycetota bacterium]|nr:MAG: NADH-quinone oxidoreductase subunit L [Planctomycetota bacterium]
MTTAIEQLNAAVYLIAPELILVVTVCVMFITGPFFVTESGVATPGLRKRWTALSLTAIGCAAFVWYTSTRTAPAGAGPFRIDELTFYVRGLTLAAGAVLAVLFAEQIDDGHAAEGQACLLAILAGVNLTAIANDLVGLFLALELVSIPTYVLLYLPRRGAANQEATAKYMLLSIFSSAIVLYGMSLLYGASGTTNLAGIMAARSQHPEASATLARVAAATLVAGLSFRIAAAPFHFYAPDVFQGVSSAAAAMLSFVPKVVGFVAILRVLPLAGELWPAADSGDGASIRTLLAALAIVTMAIGNLLALRQQHLHRLLAYSSVAHAGYMLVGLAVGPASSPISGVGALLFYLAAYGVTTIGIFALLACVAGKGAPLQTQGDLAGLSRVHPAVALGLAICLFGLTGLPPTAGFTGKLNLFFAGWSDGTPLGRTLAIVMAINAAIAAWYYLRLIAVMFLDPPAAEGQPGKLFLGPAVAGAACSAATVLLFVAPQPVWNAAARFSALASP